MKITNLNIKPIGHPNIKLTWDYESEYLDSTANHIIKIAFSENDTGPFQSLVELPINTNSWIFEQPNIKYLEFVFFEISIFNTYSNKVEHLVIAGNDIPYSRISDKIDSKYRILLKKRIGNKVLYFKRKKAGHHCRKCWDSINARVLYDNCDVCFETGYGNNSLIGLENLQLDGILKNNTESYLEFYKKDFTFNFYKLDSETKEENAGVVPGDVFQILDSNNNIMFTSTIRSLTKNGFVLENTTIKEFEDLQNLKFNVFKYQPTAIDNLKLDFKVIKINDTTAKVFYSNDFISIDKIIFLNNEYVVSNLSQESFTIIGPDIENIINARDILVLKDNAVIKTIIPEGIFYVDESLTATISIINTIQNLKSGSHFFITYFYDGINRFKVNDKQLLVGENITPGKTPGLYSLIDDTEGTVFKLKLETLSNYEKIFSDSSNEDLFQKVFSQLFKSNIYLEIRTLEIRKALEQLEVYLKPNTKFFLPHTNILPNYFRGCGVLAINLLTGITYRGQTWVNGFVDEDMAYDFYVNPTTGEFDSMSLPQGNYEIKYIYNVENIKFKSVFNWSDNNFTFIHSALKGITLPENIVLAVGTNKSYLELSIIKHYPTTGKLVLNLSEKNNRLFFDTIASDTRFSLDYPASGGYYVAEKSYINYVNDTPRALIPTDSGVNRIEKKSAIIGMDIQLNTGDLVYDILSAKFFSVDMVNENSFKGRGTHQNIQLTILSFNKQALLKKLLSR